MVSSLVGERTSQVTTSVVPQTITTGLNTVNELLSPLPTSTIE